MKKTIPIKVIVDAIEETMDGWEQFNNIVTGEVKSVPDYDNDYVDMGEFGETAEKIEESDDYIRLPSQYIPAAGMKMLLPLILLINL